MEERPVISTTDDFATFQYVPVEQTPEIMYDAAYADGLWVAVGNYGAILTSKDDGKSWQKQRSGVNTILLSVAYGGGMWMVTGSSGTILGSVDGEEWMRLDRDLEKGYSTVYDATYGDGMWIAVTSISGRRAIYRSTDLGDTWETQADKLGVVDIALTGVAYGNGMWVLYGADAQVMTSTDGKRWGSRVTDLAPKDGISHVAYCDNLWIATGKTAEISVSRDGCLTWDWEDPNTTGYPVAFATSTVKKLWVLVDDHMMASVAFSDDDEWGAVENKEPHRDRGKLINVAYGNGLWVILS